MTSHPGFDSARLDALTAAVERDIAADLYFGGVISVKRGGQPAYLKTFGYSSPAKDRKVAEDSVFSLFSVTKAFTNILIFQAIERGMLTLTTPVAKIIPEFAGGLRDRITVFHLLTHSAGLPSMFEARPGMYIDRLAEVIAAICQVALPIEAPGVRVDYAPLFNHALLGETARRLDAKKRSYRQILHEDLFEPLGMKDTSMGVRRDLKSRHLIPEFRGNYPIQHLGHSNLGPNGAFEEEEAEMPWVGCVSTASDMMRFAEMLRGGGSLDGRRIISRAMVERARTVWTGDKPNEFYANGIRAAGGIAPPANIGLGFSVRGPQMGTSLFGTLASPGAFGAHGAGTTIFWVDPERDISFVGLMTGLMKTIDNLWRWERLSDIVHAAAL
ncbi:MAG TPA: serine hydrolase domain-containing protein [Steroidobacteraceae bacterium]|jgi:CubicO group peptidase (beta-lactamase class C family)|nr:serine hydrolase domain-containing protein [Steroidobacteraceae bacterium]